MRSYHPEKLFDENGRLVAELAALAPRQNRRMGANPHANGGSIATLNAPDFMDYALGSTTGHRASRIDAPTRQDDARHIHAE